jgi:hypothetical protein
MALIVRRTPMLPELPIPGTMTLTEEIPSAGGAEEAKAAGSAETKGPDTSWVVMGYGLVILGAVAAWLLFWWIDPERSWQRRGSRRSRPCTCLRSRSSGSWNHL